MHDSPLRTLKGQAAEGIVMTPFGPATVKVAMEMVKEDLEYAKAGDQNAVCNTGEPICIPSDRGITKR